MVIPVDSSSQKVKNSRKLAPLLLIWDCQLWAIFQRVKLTIFITSQNWHWQSRNNIYWCKCPLYYTYNESKKEAQKMTRRVPRKTVKTRARCRGAPLLFSSLFIPPRSLFLFATKLMSFVIFEKFLRIPEEKMSPLSGKYILGRIIGKMEVQCLFFSLSVKPGLVFHSSEKELEELEAEVELPNWIRSAKVSGLS